MPVYAFLTTKNHSIVLDNSKMLKVAVSLVVIRLSRVYDCANKQVKIVKKKLPL